MRNNKWKRFEKLAAAIRIAEQQGASVKWNSRIEGHRFDAILCSTYDDGEYLIVLDCIDDRGPVTAARVRSFAKKSEAAGASMGIMAASSEYLQDAFELTAEHSVALLDSKAINEMSEQKLADTFAPALHVYGFRFVIEGGSDELAIPEEPALLRVAMRDIQIKGPGIDTVPERLAEEATSKLARFATGKPQRHNVPLPRGTVIIHPNTKGKKGVTSFAFTYRLIPKSELISTEGIEHDHYLVESTLKEELVKRNPAADFSKIEIGFDTVLQAGKYYYNPEMQFSYYCEAVNKRLATIVLVESYQNGGLLQARGEISSELFKQFVEVTEQSEIDRLAKIYEKFAVSDKNLEGRFKVFLRDLEGAECIDDLELTTEQQRANKADYFFENRSIIGELKALYTDTAPKVEAILAPHRETPEWPLLFGEQELSKILSHLPDGKLINAKVVEAVTNSIEGVVEKANRQIRATKETFGLPDAGGLLIILNDVVEILSPELVAYRIRRALRKRNSDGALRFPHISVVLLIGGVHYSQMTPTLKGKPILIMPTLAPEANQVEEFVSVLNAKWCAFDGHPLIQIETEMFSKLDFRRFSDDAKQSAGPSTNQEFWSAEYEKAPYLRSLNEDQLLDFGQRAFEAFSSLLIKGAPKIPQEEKIPIWVRWGNFLDEVKYRGLDMRKFKTRAEEVGERMEELYHRYQEQNHDRE